MRTKAMPWIAVVVLLSLPHQQVNAQKGTVHIVDSVTGFEISDARFTVGDAALRQQVNRRTDVDPGDWQLVVEAPGYNSRSVRIRVAGGERINVLLRPLTEPESVRSDTIDQIRKSGATLIQGFVADDATGEPLSGVAIESPVLNSTAHTDESGFFRIWLPADALAATAVGEFRLSKAGYVEMVRRHVELWSGGDWTYRVALSRGTGIAEVDEDNSRERRFEEEREVATRPDRNIRPPAMTVDRRTTPPHIAVTTAVAIPSGIRVQTSSGTVDYLDLQTYCKYVLPAEWIPSWATLNGGLGADSLDAGAVAIRTYAIGFVRQPLSSAYDICGTTACQAYDPSKVNSYTNTAVNLTANVVMVDSNAEVTFKLTEYSAENNSLGIAGTLGDGYTGDGIYDPVCATTTRNGHGRGMCQYGSARWASGLYLSTLKPHPYGRLTWQQILSHYYPTLNMVTGRALAVGDGVRVVNRASNLPVRSCSDGGIGQGVYCPSIGSRSNGSTGVLLAGPEQISADGQNWVWWKIRWDSDGLTGWSAENYLELTSAGGADTTPPVVSAFSVSPTTIAAGDSVTINITASDAGGSGLNRIELWRADDSNGSPTGWAAVATRGETGNGPVTATFTDTPGVGTFWYGAHAIDNSSNLGREPSPPGPVRVTVSVTPTQCSYAISPGSATGAAGGGNGSIQVTGSPSGCTGSWSSTASSSGSWLSLTGTSSGNGSGSWQVAYSYPGNPSTTSSRSGSVQFSGNFPAGATFTLTQPPASAGSCSYAISPVAASASSSSGSGGIQVTGSPGGCSGSWSANTGSSWLSLSGLSSGTGAGSWQVPYSFPANPDTSSRQASVSFSGAFSTPTFTLTQNGVSALPNWAPYQPSGWSGNIVVSRSPGTTLDDQPLLPSDNLYVDWAAINNGGTSITATCYFDLLVDGVLAQRWYAPPPVDPSVWEYVADFPLGTLSAGVHTLTIVADSTGVLAESNESDNQFTRTITVGGAIAPPHGDFSGDRKSDILWRHAVTGENYLWTMDGLTRTSTGTVNVTSDLNWKIAAVADFDGDGHADIFWRNAVTGENYMYLMNGRAIIGSGPVNTVADHNWKIAGAGDFNGDGRADILWRNDATGENYLYLMNGFQISSAGALKSLPDTSWSVAGLGDLNGDGRTDVVWRHSATGETYAWLMNAFSVSGAGTIETVPDRNWTVAAVADFDGDGKADLFWRNTATGENYLYLMNGVASVRRGSVNTVTDLNWRVVAAGDYDGDGRGDILWRHSVSGQMYVYFMNGISIGGAGALQQVSDLGWNVIQ